MSEIDKLNFHKLLKVAVSNTLTLVKLKKIGFENTEGVDDHSSHDLQYNFKHHEKYPTIVIV